MGANSHSSIDNYFCCTHIFCKFFILCFLLHNGTAAFICKIYSFYNVLACFVIFCVNNSSKHKRRVVLDSLTKKTSKTNKRQK